ncbi:hypothetical protein P4O66_015343, partial [Electrophorus voltai]
KHKSTRGHLYILVKSNLCVRVRVLVERPGPFFLFGVITRAGQQEEACVTHGGAGQRVPLPLRPPVESAALHLLACQGTANRLVGGAQQMRMSFPSSSQLKQEAASVIISLSASLFDTFPPSSPLSDDRPLNRKDHSEGDKMLIECVASGSVLSSYRSTSLHLEIIAKVKRDIRKRWCGK